MSDVTTVNLVAARGERKQITAVFMDIVGFSTIASIADPEDLQHWLEEFYSQARIIVEAHNGEVTEFLGDGVVAIFGLDRAEELAASKAVSAAMTALEQIDAGRDEGITLQLRVGVATGDAAVRVIGDNDHLPRVTGMVTTLAQRIQEKAAPGTAMISESTKALLRGGVATQEFANETLKGFAEAQTLFRPLGNQPNAPSKRTKFVGRTEVLGRINDSTDAALLVGQAGIGKTALARHLADKADAITTFSADGLHLRASFHPFSQWILDQIGNSLPMFTDIQAEFPTLSTDTQLALALVLGLPEGQRLLAERSNVAVKALIEDSLWQAIQLTQPDGLLVFEDLHWFDNASFGVLAHILQNAKPTDHKILMTSREDTKIGKYLDALPVTVIPLEPLSDSEAARMLDALSAGETTSEKRASVVARAAGIPLYIEYLYKRDASGKSGKPDLPSTLKDLLADQIDATGSAKPVLQCAAVIGRTFSINLLQVIAANYAPIEYHLNKARQQGVLHQIDDANWSFAHALLHQAAYDGMLRQTRITYHGQIAEHLQVNHTDEVVRNPALLAKHLSLTEQHVPAIENYLSVSQWALYQGAFDDAETHVLAAIALCEEAPDGVDVRALEIACYSALGSIRMQIQGFTAAPVKDAFETVARLASGQNAFSTANGPAFHGSFTHAIVSGDKAAAVQFSNVLRDTADTVGANHPDHELRIASLNVDTALHFCSGDFGKVSSTFEKLRNHYDFTKHGRMVSSYGVDTFAAAQMFECATRAICGDTLDIPDLIAETDAHQKLLNIPVMQPWAQIWGAVPLFCAGHLDQAIARVQKGIETATSQSAAFWQMTGGAWLHVMNPSESDSKEGLAGFDQVIKSHEMIGANVGIPYFRAHFARALAKHGKLDQAYDASLQAVRENRASGLNCWYPEILRMHARICEKQGGATGASRFRKEAVANATKQGAYLWLLRTRLDQWRAEECSTAQLRGTVDHLHPSARPPEVLIAHEILAAI